MQYFVTEGSREVRNYGTHPLYRWNAALEKLSSHPTSLECHWRLHDVIAFPPRLCAVRLFHRDESGQFRQSQFLGVSHLLSFTSLKRD